MTPSGIITLTTDFGTADSYVGAVKGVILSINPRCTVVDITHDIAPQDIMQATLALSAAYRYFPPGTIHVAVVDPGVGSSRRPLLVETERCFFIGPDNGIFSSVFKEGGLRRAFEISNAACCLPCPGTTFHGRDIFAPAAAHLSAGVSPEAFGEPASGLVSLALPEPVTSGSGCITGEIIHIDRFGNLITNVSRPLVEKTAGGGPLRAEIGSRTITEILPSYAMADTGQLFCLFGSGGYLEIAVRNGSARNMTEAVRGDRITIKKADA